MFRVLEDACKNDTELRAVLGDSIGNPELMRNRVEDRIRKKGKDFRRSKTGSVVASKVTFREYVMAFILNTHYLIHLFIIKYLYAFFACSFNPLDSYIWFELYGSPSDRDVNLIGSVTLSFFNTIYLHSFIQSYSFIHLNYAGHSSMVCHGSPWCLQFFKFAG